MPEVERKFLLARLAPPELVSTQISIEQGYLISDKGELRVRRNDNRYYLTVKSDGGLSREEWESEVPQWVFSTLWARTEGRRITKTRFVIKDAKYALEVDQYLGHLLGLITMECEFPDEHTASSWVLPQWASGSREITDEKAYKNKVLASSGLPLDGSPQR